MTWFRAHSSNTPFPLDDLTEVEKVEIASALGFHFESNCRHELHDQYEVLCGVVTRMMRRRAGLL